MEALFLDISETLEVLCNMACGGCIKSLGGLSQPRGLQCKIFAKPFMFLKRPNVLVDKIVMYRC